MKFLNIYTSDSLGQPPIRCEEITDDHYDDKDYPLDCFSKDEEGLRYQNIHIYNATRNEVLSHLRERGVKVFNEIKIKTNPLALIEIYDACKNEGRDYATTLEQVQGEIFAQTNDVELAATVGKEAFEILKTNSPGDARLEMTARFANVFA